MNLTERRKALEQTVLQATQQIGSWTEKLIGAKAQLALLAELDAEEPIIPKPQNNGSLADAY
jgi:hypothetical protein